MINFYFSNNFKGEGVSEGIERGLLVNIDNKCVVQEGMGLGAPAIRSKNGTYFSRTSKLHEISKNEFVKDFFIDTELTWSIFRFDPNTFGETRTLTVLINKLTDLYKKLSFIQKQSLKTGIASRNFFRIKSILNYIGNLGKISFRYKLLDNSVEIAVNFSDFLRRNLNTFTKICILNELGGSYFNLGKNKNRIVSPPSGWIKLPKDSMYTLYSEKFNSVFILSNLNNKSGYKFDLFCGREKISNFCWAGYDIEIDIQTNGLLNPPLDFLYQCNIMEA